jgi:flagellin-like protein
MKPQNVIPKRDSVRATSPVIGVVLMFAMTVVLAAVIGAALV